MKRFGLIPLALVLVVAAPATAREADGAYARDLYLAVIQGLRDSGKPMAALAYLDDYEAHYPSRPEAMLLRADCLADTGEADKAEPLYRAMTKGPKGDVAEAGLARIMAGRGDWAGAVEAYGRALKLRPADVGHLNDLGFALIHMGDPDAALKPLRQAAELAPQASVSRNNLILALARLGRNDEAQTLLARIPDPKERAAVNAAVKQPSGAKP